MNMTETGNQSYNVDLSATLDSADSIESGVSHLKDKPFQAQEAQCEAKSGEYVTSNFSGGYNLVNTIVGSGIIGLPYAIQLSGFGLGIFMLSLVAFLSHRSIIFLIKCGLKTGKLDYEELSEHLFGRLGFFITLIFMFLTSFGACVAYVVVIGDTIPVVLELYYPTEIMASRAVVIALFSVVIVLPLCLMKDLASLAQTSAISIVADIIIILIVLTQGPSVAKDRGIVIHRAELGTVNPSVFMGVGIMSFAFVCQQSNFIIFRGLKDRTLKSWKKISAWSIFISYALSMTLGVGGYLIFLNKTKSDVLDNFPLGGGPIKAARILLALTMVFTIPLECYVARHCLMSICNRIVLECRVLANKGSPVNPIVVGSCLSTFYRLSMSFLVWAAFVAIGLVVLDLGIVLSLTGTIAASMLAFILPSIFYFKTFEHDLYAAWIELWYGIAYVTNDTETGTEKMVDSTKNIQPGESSMVISTKGMFLKLYAFQDYFIPGVMLMFGIVSLVAGLQSIFA